MFQKILQILQVAVKVDVSGATFKSFLRDYSIRISNEIIPFDESPKRK